MKSFPPNAFAFSTGKLGHLVFENPDEATGPKLGYTLEINFEPFELEDEEVTTSVWLSGIPLPAKSWRDVASTSCDDSALNAIDGSMRLFNAMNPVFVDKLTFGESDGQTIEVTFEGEADFRMHGDEDYGTLPLNLSVKLDIDNLRIGTSIEKRLGGDPEAIAAEIQEVVDLSAYGELTKVPGGVVFPISTTD
ncbi:MAG: hypothetical protein AAGA58_04405 [Verrucomicrobiota bacterium]